MFIDLIKFIHLLATLALLGTTGFCLLYVVKVPLLGFVSEPNDLLKRLNKALLFLTFVAGLTGTLLVYPKHFTFYTPWIQAAYTLVTLFFVSVAGLYFFNRRRRRWIWALLYLFFIALLIIVVHDAVTKTTVLY